MSARASQPDGDSDPDHERHTRQTRRGFTLVELMISLAIVAVLIAILLPAVRGTLQSSRSFKCQMAQRSVAFSFSIFADESLGADRGRFQTGTQSFSLISFIDSQYQIGDFWGYPGSTQVEMPDASGSDPLRCPNVVGPVRLVSGRNCHRGGVIPPEHVSFGFNMRLHASEQNIEGQGWSAVPVRLSSGILTQTFTPLLWDVDGEAASANAVSPMLSAPTLNSPEVFAGDRYWFPGMRHGGKANFAFIDGHVKESSAPLAQREWQWRYVPTEGPLP
ncbi:MAG: prepilin-type N-terminal cleavage/methylation domain-containing protein [Phycisphaerales bacterium]